MKDESKIKLIWYLLGIHTVSLVIFGLVIYWLQSRTVALLIAVFNQL